MLMTPDSHSSSDNRLLSILPVLLPVAAVTMIVALGLGGWVTQQWSVPNHGMGFDQDNARRVREAESWYRDQARDSPDGLSIILGSCTMREAIDVPIFNASCGSDRKVMGLCGAGMALRDILRNSANVENSALRPDHIVIGLNPIDLLDIRDPTGNSIEAAEQQTNSPADERTSLRHEQIAWCNVGGLREHVGTISTQVSLRAERSLAFAQKALLGSTVNGVGRSADESQQESFDTLNSNPFREVVHLTRDAAQRHEEDEKRLSSMEPFQSKPLHTQGDGSSTRCGQCFLQLVRRWLARDVSVTVIFLPEHSYLRRRVTDEVSRNCGEFLRDSTEDFRNFRLVDLRHDLPDQAFPDVAHIGPSGRKQSVPLLSQFIIPPSSKELRAN